MVDIVVAHSSSLDTPTLGEIHARVEAAGTIDKARAADVPRAATRIQA